MNNLTSILRGFKVYLEDLNETSNKDYNTSSSEVSLFMYSNEFKNYLADELNLDSSIFSKSVDEILEMEIENGKLVDPEEETDEDKYTGKENPKENSGEISELTPENNTGSTPVEGIEGQGEFGYSEMDSEKGILQEIDMTDILNNFLQDETVIETLDTDKSGELDEEEIQAFVDTIKGYDGDEEDISLEDILTAAIDIANGDFTLNSEEEIAQEDIMIQTPVSGGQSASSNGFSGGSIPSGVQSTGRAASSNFNMPKTEEKTLDNMTEEELNSELSSAQSQLSEKQSVLASILDGSSSQMQQLQANIDAAYDTYQEQLKLVDEELAAQVDDLKQNIEAKENEITNKEAEISDQEGVVSDSENAYNNAVTTRQTLEASLESLKAIDTSNMDSAQKSSISAQISSLQTQIEEAKTAEEEAKTKWDKAEEKLKQLKEEKEKLISGQGGLDELNQQMTELEAQIVEQYPQIQQYINNYNNAKEEYKTTQAEAASAARAEIQEAQNYVNEVQTAINNIKNTEIVNDTITEANLSNGDDIVDFAYQFLNYSESEVEGALNTSLPDGLWCAAFVKEVLAARGENVPEWYQNIENKNYCPNIYNAAAQAGALINQEDVKPGDLVIFYDVDTDGGRWAHIGFVVSYENGILTTIEGNSYGDSQNPQRHVAERTYNLYGDTDWVEDFAFARM